MSQIYANACLTLSATWATNPHQGCFVIPDKRYASQTRNFTNSYNKLYKLHCHEILPQLSIPLQQRGWVFQERLLSRRIVHFMEQELWWECRESFTCECGNHDNKTLGINKYWEANPRKLSFPKSIQGQWESMVQTYQMKSLTYPSDIFPALQGLAKLVPLSMGRYLAGHWETTLARSLCWWVNKASRRYPTEWRAPSWSWAAAQGPVRWPRNVGYMYNTSMHSTVLSAMTTPKGDDPMGQISYGAIVLRGKHLVGRIRKVHELVDYYQIDLVGSRHYAVWDSLNLRDGLQVAALIIYEAFDRSGVEQYWLVLRAVKGRKDEYMRVGLLRARSVGKENAVEKEFKIV